MGIAIIGRLKVFAIAVYLLLYGCNSSRQVSRQLNNLTYRTPSINTTNTVPTQPEKNLPRVVATTSILCDLTRQIARDTVNLDCLIPNQENPRTYQLTNEAQQAINQAQLILFHGYNLEPQLIKFIRAQKNSIPKVAVAEQAQPKPRLMKSGTRMVADPFIWHDARNTAKITDIIRNNLYKLAPENAGIYTDNHKKLVKQINQLHSWIESRIESIPSYNRKFISTYPELGYYANAYGLVSQNYLQTIGGNSKLSSDDIAEFVNRIRQTRVPSIFVKANINPSAFSAISQAANVRIFERELFTYGLGKASSKSDSYQAMMAVNTRSIVEGLGGTYLTFEGNRE